MPSDVTKLSRRHGNDNAVREDDLQAYVDGQLDAWRRAAIEAHLAAHPHEAARVVAYRNQNIGLHALFDPPGGPDDAAGLADLPPALIALGRELERELGGGRAAAASLATAPTPVARPARRRAVPRLAASIALLLAAGFAGWIALQQASPSETPRVALSHENQAAPQAAIQAQPAAAAPLPGAATTDSAGAAAPVTSQPAVEQTNDPAQNPASIDPAIERTPLIPVPQPAADTASKDT